MLRITKTTPGSSAAKAECKAHAVRQITEQMNAASTRYRLFLGASSCVPFPACADESDKAASMQVEAKEARRLATSIELSMLQLGGGARAGDGAAAGDDDDDGGDDGGGSNRSKKKAARKLNQKELGNAQAANRAAKKLKSQGGNGGGGGGKPGGSGGGGGNAPGDPKSRVKDLGNSAVFSWPTSANGRPASTKTFGVVAVKKDLTAAT